MGLSSIPIHCHDFNYSVRVLPLPRRLREREFQSGRRLSEKCRVSGVEREHVVTIQGITPPPTTCGAFWI